jgi:DNA-binding NarL/FixJ family response regulator
MRPITLILVEDHHLVREALRALLEEHADFEVVGQAEDGSQVLRLAEELRPDVIIMDITMPNLNGIEATLRLQDLDHVPCTIILSQYRRDEYIAQSLLAGANGYLLKDSAADELPAAIRAVVSGEAYLSEQLCPEAVEELLARHQEGLSPLDRLTPREREVLQLVAEGNTNRRIAFHLGISIKTVEKHRASLMDKLGIRDVAGLVRFAIMHGIIKPEGS